MPEYQLQIKQVVDYPRCRIYREFIHKLINDRSIRINGGSGLFHFTVLCSYANFRTSYRRIDGISYTVSPGEWVCTVKELSCWFRTRFHRQALSMLDTHRSRTMSISEQRAELTSSRETETGRKKKPVSFWQGALYSSAELWRAQWRILYLTTLPRPSSV